MPGPAFDKCPGWAGRPGSLGVAGRESLISTGVAGRRARVGDPPVTLPTLPPGGPGSLSAVPGVGEAHARTAGSGAGGPAMRAGRIGPKFAGSDLVGLAVRIGDGRVGPAINRRCWRTLPGRRSRGASVRRPAPGADSGAPLVTVTFPRSHPLVGTVTPRGE